MTFLNATDPYFREVKRDRENNAFDARNLPGAVLLEGSLGGPVLDALQNYANSIARGLRPSSAAILDLTNTQELTGLAYRAVQYLDSRKI